VNAKNLSLQQSVASLLSVGLNFQQKKMSDLTMDDPDLEFLIENTGNGVTSWTLQQLFLSNDDVDALDLILEQININTFYLLSFIPPIVVYSVFLWIFYLQDKAEKEYISIYYGYEDQECKFHQMRIAQSLS
jgi:hypothetical protein